MFTKAVRMALPIAMALSGLVLLIYKAWALDFTNDEAYSYHIVKNFWLTEALCTGNTHWLNSGALWVATALGGESPLALRWLSIISYAAVLLVLLLQIKKHNVFVATALLVLVAWHPYVLDYFSMARGYAPAIALQALALFTLFNGQSVPARPLLALCLACASVVANYSFIYFFVPFCVIYFYLIYYKNKGSKPRLLMDLFLAFGTLGIFVANYRFIMHCSGDVTGAGSAQLSQMLEWVWKGFLYEAPAYSEVTNRFCSMVMLSLFVACAFYGVAFRKQHKVNLFLYTSLVCFGMLFVALVSGLFINDTFPAYRSALFFHVPGTICFVFSLRELFWKTGTTKGIVTGLLGGIWLSSLVVYHSKRVCDYPGTADARSCFDNLQCLDAKHVGLCPELYGTYRNYYSAIGKYKYEFEGEWLNASKASGWRDQSRDLKRFDYIVIIPPFDLSYYNNNRSLQEVCSFKESKAKIYKLN